GALRTGVAVCLLDGDIAEPALVRLVGEYRPDWVFSTGQIALAGYSRQDGVAGFVYNRHADAHASPISSELAVLLPTSGSNGSPKLVRLSYANLQANAASIVEYLGIAPDDRCITLLPMAYSYGLSVLHTHLLAGAEVLMTTSGFLQREFWTLFRGQR